MNSLIELIFPRRCPVCGRRMLPSEECVCLKCLVKLPRVHGDQPGNEAEHRLFGRIPFEHSTAFCYYSSQGVMSRIIVPAKYNGQPWLNSQLTRLFVQELRQASSPWPFDVDCIVPIPVHWFRRLKRGYNQSVAIAEALSEQWHLPVEYDCLKKSRYTTSQVGLRLEQRLHHVEGSFEVKHPERLEGRHLLLVDDVMTTGATFVAAYDALRSSVKDFRVSILALTLTSE